MYGYWIRHSEIGRIAMLDGFEDLLQRQPIRNAQRNVPRPDFRNVIYIYREASHVRRAGEWIWVPRGWLVVNRERLQPDQQ